MRLNALADRPVMRRGAQAGAGMANYTNSTAGRLLTEDGPWSSDTVTNTYANRLRTGLNLASPPASGPTCSPERRRVHAGRIIASSRPAR